MYLNTCLFSVTEMHRYVRISHIASFATQTEGNYQVYSSVTENPQHRSCGFFSLVATQPKEFIFVNVNSTAKPIRDDSIKKKKQ